jgi:uncharacterized protein (DUF305 family)
MYEPHEKIGPPRVAANRRPRLLIVLFALLAVAPAAGCTDRDEPAPVTVQPGAPGEPGRVVAPGQAGSPVAHTGADVRFVRAMIVHHRQALGLTSLVPGRAQHRDIRLLARRIEISQVDEIARLESWLAGRGEPPAGHDHSGAEEPMPGMLTQQQLTELAEATGADFDRRFLESMIFHHEGALIMVHDLYASGGGQEAELDQMAGHIDSDQRIEISRMHHLLATLAPPG